MELQQIYVKCRYTYTDVENHRGEHFNKGSENLDKGIESTFLETLLSMATYSE